MMEYTFFIITHSVMISCTLVIFLVGKGFWADNKKMAMDDSSFENIITHEGRIDAEVAVSKQTSKVYGPILKNSNLIFE